MLLCQFCFSEGEKDDFELDKNGNGFWCPCCDGFNYYSHILERHQFILIMEDTKASSPKTKNRHTRFKKQLSPLRYPGGKSKAIPYLAQYLNPRKSETLISPFVGGGSFELALLDAGLVKRLHLNDLDYGIYSLWWTILHEPFSLMDKMTRLPTHDDYFEAQRLIKSDYLGADMVEAAWATLLVNRLAYSGIAKANPLGGRNGSTGDLLSRWNPNTLQKRIEHIHRLGDSITLSCLTATELIEEMYWGDNSTLFIDPPYIQKGKALYNHFYTMEDHAELSCLLDSLHQGMPGADILVTYDFHEWLYENYNYPQVEILGRHYSI